MLRSRVLLWEAHGRSRCHTGENSFLTKLFNALNKGPGVISHREGGFVSRRTRFSTWIPSYDPRSQRGPHLLGGAADELWGESFSVWSQLWLHLPVLLTERIHTITHTSGVLRSPESHHLLRKPLAAASRSSRSVKTERTHISTYLPQPADVDPVVHSSPVPKQRADWSLVRRERGCVQSTHGNEQAMHRKCIWRKEELLTWISGPWVIEANMITSSQHICIH